MGVEKMSVSFDLDLGEAIRIAAADDSQSVSSWLAEAARDRLRLVALGRAVKGWERKYGALTEKEVDAAERVLAHAAQTPSRRRAG